MNTEKHPEWLLQFFCVGVHKRKDFFAFLLPAFFCFALGGMLLASEETAAAALAFGGVATAPAANANDSGKLANAIASENLAELKRLINAGATLVDKDHHWSAMVNAAHRGSLESMKILLAAGVEPDAIGGDGDHTALCMAVTFPSNDHLEMIKILLMAGANPRIKCDLESAGSPLGIAQFRVENSPIAFNSNDTLERRKQVLSLLESVSADPQYVPALRREHCEWLQDMRCEDEEKDAAAKAKQEKQTGSIAK